MTGAGISLAELLPGLVREEAPLAPLTTLGVGGPAAVLVKPRREEEIRTALIWAREHEVPWAVLGGGSNLLVPDLGFPGLVIRIGPPLDRLENPSPGLLEVGAGLSVHRLLDRAREDGLAGLDCLAGLPGTIGGAVAGNAGAGPEGILERVEAVRGIGPDGPVSWGVDRLSWGYRRCRLPRRVVITRVRLRLEPSSPELVERSLARALEGRRGQPGWRGTAGCVFRNPPGDSAGRLIDDCGLKGLSQGGARVSEEHANFIVCQRGATAGDVLRLIQQVADQVEERTGHRLEPEIALLTPGEEDQR